MPNDESAPPILTDCALRALAGDEDEPGGSCAVSPCVCDAERIDDASYSPHRDAGGSLRRSH